MLDPKSTIVLSLPETTSSFLKKISLIREHVVPGVNLQIHAPPVNFYYLQKGTLRPRICTFP